MGNPILTLVYDRKKTASRTREASVELRITYERKQRYLATGVRLLPKHWKNGQVRDRIDAYELQETLDNFLRTARTIINEMTEKGILDIGSVTALLKERMCVEASKNVVVEERQSFLDYMAERITVRKFGKSVDTGERYDRFMRWMREWKGIVWFNDVTDVNIIRMDKVLDKKGMKPYSKWNNYHRFLNSFIIDAMDEGLLRRNPYRWLKIDKDKKSHGLERCLSPEEFSRIEHMDVVPGHLERVRDLFVFQVYTCLSYVDLASFDASKIINVNGRKAYTGYRGKTKQQYSFLLLQPALDILEKYDGRLPVISNVKYNEYLKSLAMAAGISKPVSSHWARHTGATLLLNVGHVDMEIVARVLGHSSPKMTREVYAKLYDETVVSAMSGIEKLISPLK